MSPATRAALDEVRSTATVLAVEPLALAAYVGGLRGAEPPKVRVRKPAGLAYYPQLAAATAARILPGVTS